MDKYNKGFWCGDCDSYNYIHEEDEDRRFYLIMESKDSKDTARRSIDRKFNKRLSPLRYPGGKSKVTDYLYTKLISDKSKLLVSPYAGGASVELALLHAGVIEELHLNDVDYGVYALFQIIKTNVNVLVDQIRSTVPTRQDYFKSQKIILSGYANCSLEDAAWHMLVNNRLAFSGIYDAYPLGGKNGDSSRLLSRWIPEGLIKRIQTIHTMSDRIKVTNEDACEIIEEAYWGNDTSILIDPPYYKKGQRLYRCSYNETDHLRLNMLLESLYSGFPGADMILCYDDEKYIEDLYVFPQIEKIRRTFSA
ncbi:hypothetical protein A8L34_27815 [Bacillus sp. FJAT-27264]|nr:hypothetical protein A8L34_27815 [Bacillus sp. FJAT-27264]